MNSYDLIDLRDIKTFSLFERKSKVNRKNFGKVFPRGGSFKDFWDCLPNILAGKDLKEIVSRIILANQENKIVMLAMGAHPLKVGLSPIIINLMKKGIFSAIALNGAGIIHDFELAMVGHTSEDVDSHIADGSFGMCRETGEMINEAINEGVTKNWGIGRAVGEKIIQLNPPFIDQSVLAAGVKLNIPTTIHVTLGADTIHLFPAASGAAIGEGSHQDFRLFSSVVSRLEEGVYINLGSAVVLPEVFLKAITLVRNLGFKVKNFTTVNLDIIQHYRPVTNVVKRPTQGGGMGYCLTGHHEILFPLLSAGILAGLEIEAKDLA